jgi:hypothetical protein
VSPLLVLLLARTAAPAELDKDPWREVLAAHVNQAGEVAYRSLARRSAERVEEALRRFAPIDPATLDHDGAVAFWINAYNALVLSAVTHGESPEALAARARMFHWFGATIGGSRRTLDDISLILEPAMKVDPRIHFALANGTRGGPALAAEPYVADQLDAQLAAAARRFVADLGKNHFDVFGGGVELSRLFEWYRADFEKEAGSLTEYVRRLVGTPGLKWFLSVNRPDVGFQPFDWTLNAAAGERPG